MKVHATEQKLSDGVLSTPIQRGDHPVGRPRTRKVKAGKLVQLSINLDGGLIARLDREAEVMSKERPGLSYTRSDVVRVAIHAWLDEREKGEKGRKK